MGALSISSSLYLGRFIWKTKSERSLEEEVGVPPFTGLYLICGERSGAGPHRAGRALRGLEGAGSQLGQPSALPGDRGRQSLSFTPRAELDCDKGAGASETTRHSRRGCQVTRGPLHRGVPHSPGDVAEEAGSSVTAGTRSQGDPGLRAPEKDQLGVSLPPCLLWGPEVHRVCQQRGWRSRGAGGLGSLGVSATTVLSPAL